VQVNNLPAFDELSQDDSAAVDESGSIVEMKGDNCNVPGNLSLEVPRFEGQVWSFSSSGTNLLEYLPEVALVLRSAVGSLGNRSGLEDGRFVGERSAESFPVEIIEGLNERRQGIPYLRFLRGAFVDLGEGAGR
jgi:hypothetical protein